MYAAAIPGGPGWLSAEELEGRLNLALVGENLLPFALRSRSKYVKRKVCEALGYEVPDSFRKTRPRFPAQDLDVYVQQSDNLQIWNQEVVPNRRYAIVRADVLGVVKCVKVVVGTQLAAWDRTGTLTSKYQARYRGELQSRLLSDDTRNLQPWLRDKAPEPPLPPATVPTDAPSRGSIFRARDVFAILTRLLGSRLPYHSVAQERRRAVELHRAVCKELGYRSYADTGAFPDIPNQMIEVKLQTSPTVDLGLASPDSSSAIAGLEDEGLRVCDVRYAVFYAKRVDDFALVQHLALVSGEAFFSDFERMAGLGVNRKLQIPLPKSLFAGC